jgi:fatty-acyl-CoA synthase
MASNPSYTVGVSPQPLLGCSIGACLRAASTAHADDWAVISRYQDCRLTYGQLQREVARVARALLAAKVERGERVAIWSPASVEWIVAQYAVASIGAILVTLNPGYGDAELAHAVCQAAPSLLFASAHCGNQADRHTRRRVRKRRVDVESNERPSVDPLGPVPIVHLDEDTGEDGVGWKEFVRRGDDVSEGCLASREDAVESDDPACIVFTSGTTGVPKGATLSHHSIVNCGWFTGERLRYSRSDRICLPMPMHHVLASVMGNVAALTHGSCVVIPDELFGVSTCVETIQQEACTALYGVPTMFQAILTHRTFTADKVKTLRTGIIAGAPCPASLMHDIVTTMHIPELTCCYGMTESPPITQTLPDESLDNRVSTVGSVQPYVECKIIDPETGRVVPRDTPGELCARGYGVMSGYWNDTVQTDLVIDRHRWIHTGDMAMLHDDNRVSIVGRLKDTIIRGGENIYPRDIEAILQENPSIAEAYVIGVPDLMYGEEVCACIRIRDGSELSARDLRHYCRERLADHNIPRYVRHVNAFPMTATGKVQRFRLRQLMAMELGLDQIR